MHVLMIDESRAQMKYWITRLEEAGDTVTFTRDVDEVFRLLEKNTYDIIIFEMVLSPGERYGNNRQVDGGWTTGQLLAEDLRALYPALPMLCFRTSDIRHKIDPDLVIPTTYKMRLLPREFVHYLNKLVESGVPQP